LKLKKFFSHRKAGTSPNKKSVGASVFLGDLVPPKAEKSNHSAGQSLTFFKQISLQIQHFMLDLQT
jgi:hypothetical protein